MTFLGLRARIDAILHKLLHPSHRVLWHASPSKCDIACDTCSHLFWCRQVEKPDEDDPH